MGALAPGPVVAPVAVVAPVPVVAPAGFRPVPVPGGVTPVMPNADADGKISRAQYLSFQQKIFDMMDMHHDGMLTKEEMLATGGANTAH